MHDNQDDGVLLESLLREALSGLEFRHWGYFFPFLLATWRFILARRPGVLDPLDASYDDPPKFRGRGSTWFCGTLANTPEFLDREERVMYWIVSRIPERAKLRGFLHATEVPHLDIDELQIIARFVLNLVDQDKAKLEH
jgi:hypothetical protein